MALNILRIYESAKNALLSLNNNNNTIVNLDFMDNELLLLIPLNHPQKKALEEYISMKIRSFCETCINPKLMTIIKETENYSLEDLINFVIYTEKKIKEK